MLFRSPYGYVALNRRGHSLVVANMLTFNGLPVHPLIVHAVVVLLLATLIIGRHADRVEEVGAARPLTRATTGLAVLTAVFGIVVTGLVVWIGDAGAAAVWQGVGAGR